MLEEAVSPEKALPTVKPVKKGGRPKKAPRVPKLAKSQDLMEVTRDEGISLNPAIAKNEWPTKKAIKIKIHRNMEEGDECIFQLGDSPLLRIRRNVEVIVPYDIKGILDDCVVDMPRCHMEPGQPISYYTEKVTRFEYSFFGEVPWQEYLDFRAAQKKLK